MRNPVPLPIERLLMDAGNGRLEIVAGYLHQPEFNLLRGADQHDFTDLLDRLKGLVAHRADLCALVELHLTADWLLTPDGVSPGAAIWLQASGCLARWLPWMKPEHVDAAHWLAVPILLAGPGNRAAVRYLMAGSLKTDGPVPLIPEWAETLCDRQAKAAIFTAGRLSAKPGSVFHVFPLLAPGADLAVCGPSLGLPLAIALRQLCAEESYPAAVVLTGTLAPDGTLEAVEALEAKCRAAVLCRFKHMIYPAANREPKCVSGVEPHPAADLNEAAILALLAARDRRGPTRTLARMLADAGTFVAHLASVPADWIAWSVRTKRLDAILDQILADPDLLADLARQLERLIEAGNTAAAAAVGRLLPPETAETVSDGLLDSAFRWAVNCLALANRLGRVTEAAAWDRTAAGLVARACGIGRPDAMARHANIAFVHREQGRYHFTPQIPETLAALMHRFEQRAEEDRALGCPVNPIYGALCGTLAQHYGFCGPAWIASTEEYIRKARRAFGDGAVPARRSDWLRPLNYRCCARLDAGDPAGAQATLMVYLETDGWDAVLEKVETLDRWQHALVARFLADVEPPEATDRYRAWAETFSKEVPEGHPWQLWAHNLGRMAQNAKEPKAAERYYRFAIQCCRDSVLGPTVQVMALLPLAGLDALGMLAPAAVEEEIGAVRKAAAQLDPDHFQPVFQMEPAALLALVRDRPQRLFPFSYR